MTRTSPPRPVVALLVALHVAVTTFVWRDIGRRPDAQIRGPKTLWRVLTALNTGNSLVYLLLGRKQA